MQTPNAKSRAAVTMTGAFTCFAVSLLQIWLSLCDNRDQNQYQQLLFYANLVLNSCTHDKPMCLSQKEFKMEDNWLKEGRNCCTIKVPLMKVRHFRMMPTDLLNGQNFRKMFQSALKIRSEIRNLLEKVIDYFPCEDLLHLSASQRF